MRLKVVLFLTAILLLSSCSNRRYGNRTVFRWHAADAKKQEAPVIKKQERIETPVMAVKAADSWENQITTPEVSEPIKTLPIEQQQSKTAAQQTKNTLATADQFVFKRLAKKVQKRVVQKIKSKPTSKTDSSSDLLYWILVVLLVILVLTLLQKALGDLYGIFILVVLIVLLGHILGLW